MTFSTIASWQIDGETVEAVADFIFSGKITVDGDSNHEIKRPLLLGKKTKRNLAYYSILKSRDITLLNKDLSSQSYGFSNSRVWMWELDHKESWVPKNWCFRIVLLEKTLESPLGCKEVKPVNPKGDQPWIFIGRTDAEVPILWPPDVKSRLIRKDTDAGKVWGQEEVWLTEDEMVGWHHRPKLHEFEQPPGDTEGQGSLQSVGLQT